MKLMREVVSLDHLLGIKNLQREDIELIFKTADNFKRIINQEKKGSYLKRYYHC